jgi:hypothetical protein
MVAGEFLKRALLLDTWRGLASGRLIQRLDGRSSRPGFTVMENALAVKMDSRSEVCYMNFGGLSYV